jgi:hypothetical protein
MYVLTSDEEVSHVHLNIIIISERGQSTFVHGIVLEYRDFLWRLTVLLHVDLQTLVEATGLALVAARDVNHAMPALLADVVQITANHNNDVCFNLSRM